MFSLLFPESLWSRLSAFAKSAVKFSKIKGAAQQEVLMERGGERQNSRFWTRVQMDCAPLPKTKAKNRYFRLFRKRAAPQTTRYALSKSGPFTIAYQSGCTLITWSFDKRLAVTTKNSADANKCKVFLASVAFSTRSTANEFSAEINTGRRGCFNGRVEPFNYRQVSAMAFCRGISLARVVSQLSGLTSQRNEILRKTRKGAEWLLQFRSYFDVRETQKRPNWVWKEFGAKKTWQRENEKMALVKMLKRRKLHKLTFLSLI